MLDRLPVREVPSTLQRLTKTALTKLASLRSASAKSDAALSKLDTVEEQHNEG